MNSFITRSARFSDDRLYRYELWRRWDDTKPYVLFIGLNPSTADENFDDPTIRRCIGFAQRWGFGALCMCNLFAFRATNPKEMKCAVDPIGDGNDVVLVSLCANAGQIISAWGNGGAFKDRDFDVMFILSRKWTIYCLDRTSSGQPKHPLYCRTDTILKEYQNAKCGFLPYEVLAHRSHAPILQLPQVAAVRRGPAKALHAPRPVLGQGRRGGGGAS